MSFEKSGPKPGQSKKSCGTTRTSPKMRTSPDKSGRMVTLIITGDGKWVVYDNVVRKISWSKRDEPAQSISKEGNSECLVGFQRYCLFRAAPKEPNYQFECLLSPANEIGQRNKGKAARTGNS